MKESSLTHILWKVFANDSFDEKKAAIQINIELCKSVIRRNGSIKKKMKQRLKQKE